VNLPIYKSPAKLTPPQLGEFTAAQEQERRCGEESALPQLEGQPSMANSSSERSMVCVLGIVHAVL
jgi:hypothetical protein